MGFRYRKSINLGGGFRINLSKSGVGYSWGTKGYRVTKTASGKTRQTFSIPGTGISYVSERGGNSQRSNRSRTRTNAISRSQRTLPNVDQQRNIESAEIEKFQATEFEDITVAISRTIRLNTLSTVLLWLGLLLFAHPAFVFFPIVGAITKILVHVNGAVTLEYNFDAEKQDEHNRRIGAWLVLSESDKEWQIVTEQYNSNTKIHAGASRSLNRTTCRVKKTIPFYLKTNVDIIQISLKKETMLILPDKVFIVRGAKVGAEDYSKIKIQISETSFVEAGPVPKDAQISHYTWQYVNKNGTPDRRYKNNRQLPVCRYGVVTLRSDSGINVEIQVSNVRKSQDFSVLISD